MTHASVGETPTKLRADAEKNRQTILDVAGRMFAERGLEVTLNEIAHEAGLGVGTVYRRFPDKESLIEALSDEKLRQLHGKVAAALALPTTAEAFRELLLGAAEARANDQGLFQVIFRGGIPSSAMGERVLRLLHSFDDAIERARAEGHVRPGFSRADVDLFMIMVGAVADATRAVDDTAWRRAADVLLDGYAAHPGDDRVPRIDLTDAERYVIFLH